MKFLYNIFISVYTLGVKLVSPFNDKAKLWLAGRHHVLDKLQAAFEGNKQPVVWMHCASLGEFEQGRPLIEALKNNYTGFRILVTFFSPSGYEVQKNYPHADFIFYLPPDTPKNAKYFFDITKPALIFFIKYEFWFHYLSEAKNRNISLLLVSGVFRRSQIFFKSYGALHRAMLQDFTHFFLQDANSALLLKQLKITCITVSGDTRFDRVTSIAENFTPVDGIDNFCRDKKVIVAGSTWTEDDEELDHFANTHPDMRFIIAPHDISEERLKECEKLYHHAVRYSAYIKNKAVENTSVLIIDNIGLLSRLYKYATICYVGGAFGGDGVHNVLEAAVYKKPVVFGPVYDKFIEAAELIDAGGAFTVIDALELEKTLNALLGNNKEYVEASEAAGNYIKTKTGATKKIMEYIQENRLLISSSK